MNKWINIVLGSFLVALGSCLFVWMTASDGEFVAAMIVFCKVVVTLATIVGGALLVISGIVE